VAKETATREVGYGLGLAVAVAALVTVDRIRRALARVTVVLEDVVASRTGTAAR
jgi:hypothetical protein